MNNILKISLIAIIFLPAYANEKIIDVFTKLKLGDSPAEVRKMRPLITTGSFFDLDEKKPGIDELIKESEKGSKAKINLMEKFNGNAFILYNFEDNVLESCTLAFRPVAGDNVPSAVATAFGGLAAAVTFANSDIINVEWKTDDGFVRYSFPAGPSRDNSALQLLSPAVRESLTTSDKLEPLSNAQKKVLDAHFKKPQG